MTTTLTDEALKGIHQTVAHIASQGGPYSGIMDLSQVVYVAVTSDTIRALAATGSAIPAGRLRVIVAKAPVMYGLSRMLQLCRGSTGGQLEVVNSMDEAYDLLGVSPEDFTQRLFPEDLAA
jgi:hypothetical protein